MKKTVRQWLMSLKDEDRDDAIKNIIPSSDTEVVESLEQAIKHINWGDNFDRWISIHYKISVDRYFDAYQQTEEDCKKEAETILEEAMRIQGGDRQQDYGDPTENFKHIADIWNAYIGEGSYLYPRDVAHMMILMKVARNCHKPKRDNWTDIAGYAQCGAKIDKV